jgi:hypothetical protein
MVAWIVKSLIGLVVAAFAISLVALVLMIVLPTVGVVLMVIALLITLGLLALAVTIPLRLIFGRKDENSGDDWDHMIYDADSDIGEEDKSNLRHGESGDDHSSQGTKIGRKSPRQIDLDPFTRVRLLGMLRVRVLRDDRHTVLIDPATDGHHKVRAKVAEGVLTVLGPARLSGAMKGGRGLRVTVTTPSIEALVLKGVGAASLKNVAADALELQLDGAGKISASGSCSHLDATVAGVGKLAAESLTAETVRVRVDGVGKAVVYATAKLDARVDGAGKIVCHGQPKDVEKAISGVGKVELT